MRKPHWFETHQSKGFMMADRFSDFKVKSDRVVDIPE